MSTALHSFIEKHNILSTPTKKIDGFFRSHPNLYKVALVINHLFRAFAMTGMMFLLPFSPFINCALCFSGSLFYRLTVETNCAFKFALPAMAGSCSLQIALQGIKAVAASAMTSFAGALTIVPFIGYLTYVVLTVDYDVDHRCCSR